MIDYGRIIIFCDYGIDDAVATLHILSRAEMFKAIDIVPVGGNVDVKTAYRNAHTVLSEAKREGVCDLGKVRIVDSRMIEQPKADIPEVHGRDGLGDILAHEECDVEVIDYDEFAAQIERVREPERDCVLSLGPCTIPYKLGYVPFCTVLMGGATNEKPNYGRYEFNEALDPNAFADLSERAAGVATLDTCHDDGWDFPNFRTGIPLADRLIDRSVMLCKARGEKKIAIYDYCAALAVTNPEKFDVVRKRRPDGVEYNELILVSKNS